MISDFNNQLLPQMKLHLFDQLISMTVLLYITNNMVQYSFLEMEEHFKYLLYVVRVQHKSVSTNSSCYVNRYLKDK